MGLPDVVAGSTIGIIANPMSGSDIRRVIDRRCSAVVLLGGDGTMRAAVGGLGDTPMLALSTGTNNAAYRVVLAPIAPGLLENVGISAATRMEFGPQDFVTVTLERDGPLVIDVPAVLAVVADTAAVT
jgi:predicted polyphosphate/ATP-dependent NAD kinase